MTKGSEGAQVPEKLLEITKFRDVGSLTAAAREAWLSEPLKWGLA